MGSPARNEYSGAVSGPQAIPIHPPEFLEVIPEQRLLEQGEFPQYGTRAGRRLGSAVEAVSRTYTRAWARLSDTYHELSFRTREIKWRAQARARATREERPLQLIGIIAGVAFAAGVAARIWRSRHS